MTDPSTPRIDESTLPPGVSTTFTWQCVFGCTVHVVDGQEQRHDCAGVAIIAARLPHTRGCVAHLGSTCVCAAARRRHADPIAEDLKPLLRDRLFDSWKDGVLSGRRGLCYGVDDDIPDGSIGSVPPTLAAQTHAEAMERVNPGLAEAAPGGRLTTDPTDPRLTHGVDAAPVPQAEAYLVLSEEERAKGFTRPVRRAYRHTRGCGTVTTMSQALAETYARQPTFYGATYCCGCQMHAAVAEFDWEPSWGETIPAEHLVVGS